MVASKRKVVKLYCDGSSLGNPGPGGYGGILVYGDVHKTYRGGEAMTTNNRMELRGVIEGLKLLKEPCDVTVISDSTYVVKAIGGWLAGWVAKDFKGVKNIDLWQEYLRVSQPHIVHAQWVRGHDGHPQNEACDRIAREEALRYKEMS